MSLEHQARTPFNWRLESTETHGFSEELKRKELILKAATTLFANQGYSGTSVKQIVEMAGVTKPTLYYYFKNKEDLYLQLIDDSMQTFFTIFDGAAKVDGTMRVRLITILAEIYRLLRENTDLLRLVNSIVYGPRGAAPVYDLKSRNQQFETALRHILRSGIDEGELGEEDIDKVLLLLVGLIRSIQLFLVVKPASKAIPLEQVKSAIDMIFDGAKRSAAS